MTKHVLYLSSIISSYHHTNQNKTSKQQKTKTNQKNAKQKRQQPNTCYIYYLSFHHITTQTKSK